MKTLLIALTSISLLAACSKQDPAPSATSPAVPADRSAATEMAAPLANTRNTEVAPATATTPATVSESSGSSMGDNGETSVKGMHVVEQGETLWGIAAKHGISHGKLAEWNNVQDPRELQIGRKLTLSAP